MTGNTHRELEFNKILEMLREQALSDKVKERIEQMSPYMNEREALRHMEDTTMARKTLETVGNPPLASMTELLMAVEMIEMNGMLNPEQLTAVAVFISTCNRMKNYLKRAASASESISDMGYSISDLSPLQGEIEVCIRNGRVDDKASSELSSVRKKIAMLTDKTKDKLNSILKSNEQYLSDGFIVSRNGKLTIAVKREYRNRIPGSVIDKSNTGGTVFIEPESVGKIQSEIANLLVEEDIEIKKVLYTLTAMVEDELSRIKINMEAMETLDFIFAKAKLSIQMKGIPAEITNGSSIELTGGRHPLLDSEKVIPLDFRIGYKDDSGDLIKAIIITGPNTGGKTVVLKTIGLFSLMVQCGLHIPAKKASFCMRNMVLCDIGDGQSITENLSTFSSHMTRIINILDTADDQSLVLLDELGSGTDPTEGMGIAAVVLEEMMKRGCLIAATTHYPEIKDFARNSAGFVNARMAFDRENLAPLYRLEIGEAGESCALYIARRIGLSLDMVERAHRAAYHQFKGSSVEPLEFNASEFSGIVNGEKEKSFKKPRLAFIDRNKVEAPDLSGKFGIGDSVIVHPQEYTAIVFRKADKNGMVGVQIKKKKYLVNHKRVELKIPASELYPDDYDFSIIFDTVDNRKAKHRMTKRHREDLVVTFDDEYEIL
jgi:DNA mismatch repair protein MutS2